MFLFLLSQDIKNGYDTFDSVVVCAEDEDEARKIHPSRYVEKLEDWSKNYTWANNKEQVEVKLIGKAADNIQKGVVLVSFNAG